MQLTAWENANNMRNTTCVDTQTSNEWPYCSFLCCGGNHAVDRQNKIAQSNFVQLYACIYTSSIWNDEKISIQPDITASLQKHFACMHSIIKST